MAVSKVAEVTAARSTTGDRSPTATFTSWTPALNDLVVLFCSDNLQGRTIAIPGTWVNPLGGTTDVESDAHEMCAVYHWVTQAEVDAVTMTYTATDLYDASVTTGRTSGIVLRGVDPDAPIDGTGTWSITTNSTAHHFPAVVAGDVTFDNDMVVRAVCHDGTGAYTNPASHTVSTNATATQSMLVSTRDAATTAGVAVADTTVTQGTSGEGVGITLAIAEIPPPPPAGPQLDGSVVEAEAAAAAATTGARDVATARSVWIFVTHNNSSAATLTSAVTDNSGSITPTLVARRNTQQGTVAEIWRGYNSSGSTVSGYTVTATGNNGGGGTLTRTHIVLAVFSGEEETFGGDSDVASSASGLPSITLTTTRDDSWCWSVKADWSAGGVGTPGTSQALVHNYSSAEYDSDVWNRTDRVTSGNNVTLNETAPAAQNYNQVAVEIRLAAGGALSATADPAVLVLTGIDAAAAGTGVSTTTVDAAIFTLAGIDPTAAGSGEASTAADPAVLILSGVDVTADAGATSATVDPAVLTLTGVTPDAAGTGSASTTIDTATLTLTGIDAAATGSGAASQSVDPAVLTLTGITPTAAGNGTASQTIDVAILVLAGVDVTASSGGSSVEVDPAILTLAGINVSVGLGGAVVDVASLTLIGVDLAAAGTGNAAIIADAATLVLTGVDVVAVGTGGTAVLADTATLILSGVDVPPVLFNAPAYTEDLTLVAVGDTLTLRAVGTALTLTAVED